MLKLFAKRWRTFVLCQGPSFHNTALSEEAMLRELVRAMDNCLKLISVDHE